MSNVAIAAVFDLGGVLINWDPRAAYLAEFPERREQIDRFLETTLTDIGLATCETPGALADVVAPWRDSGGDFVPFIDFFASHWPRFVRGPIPGSVSLVERLLARSVPVYGLTNWPEATFPPEGEAFGFLAQFIDIIVSGREGMRKPDAAIFRLAIDRFGIEPASTVYVDDHAGNVQTAARLGFRAHHFSSPAMLEGFLVDSGLL